jgi:acyl transferase domain-containing protein
VHYISTLRRGRDASLTMLEAAGKLWSKGYPIKFQHVNSTNQNPTKLQKSLVSLPSYPWNHSNRYWHESSISYNRRFNPHPRLDLLGIPVEDINHHEPRWRNILRISELPWLGDHVVQGTVLFPAAGMLVMALEAGVQLAEKDKPLEGFELRDVSIGHAHVLQSTDTGVQTMLQIRPHRIGTKAATGNWLSFNAFSLGEGQDWIENCSGLLLIKYKAEPSEVEHGLEAMEDLNSCKEEYNSVQQSCTKVVQPRRFYDSLKELGLQFGPLFQNVTKIKAGSNMAACSVKIPDTKATMPEAYEYDHLIHPATLDGFIQTVFAAVSGSNRVKEGMVPTSIESVFVSADMSKGPGTEFCGFTKASKTGFRESAGSLTMSNDSWTAPLVVIKGLKFTELASMTVDSLDDSSNLRKICAEIKWKQDVHHLSDEKAQALMIEDNLPPNVKEAIRYNQLEKIAVLYMKRALSNLLPETEEAIVPHLKLYVAWMRRQYAKAREGALDRLGDSGPLGDPNWLEMDESEANQLMNWAREESLDGKLMCSIGENLPEILAGTVDPLSLMLEDNMLTRYYSDSVGITQYNNNVDLWFDKAGHFNPNLRVLEVGGGTASASKSVLSRLVGEKGSTPRLDKYVFTDISTGFFGNARTVLADCTLS